MRRSTACIVLAALLLPVLSSCSSSGSSDIEDGNILEYPKSEIYLGTAVRGEKAESKRSRVVLYDYSQDGIGSSTSERTVNVAYGDSLPRIVVESYFRNYRDTNGIRDEINVLSVEESAGLITVNLSAGILAEFQKKDLYSFLIGMTNSILSLDDAYAVNILIDNNALFFEGLPFGVQTEIVNGIAAGYAQFEAEMDFFTNSSSGSFTRDVFFYRPVNTENLYVPELRTVTFRDQDFTSALLTVLYLPSYYESASFSIPEDITLFSTDPRTFVDSDGNKALALELSHEIVEYSVTSGCGLTKLYGSIVLTLTSFLPDLDAVYLYVNGEPVSAPGSGYAFTRQMFDDVIGDSCILWLPVPGKGLKTTNIGLSQADSHSAQSVLEKLFERDEWKEMFCAASGEDVLGISIESGTVYVNLSEKLYQAAQSLSEIDERAAVFAIVNTLTEMDDINSVFLLIEDNVAETLSGNVVLDTPLLYNPGYLATNEEDDYETDYSGE